MWSKYCFLSQYTLQENILLTINFSNQKLLVTKVINLNINLQNKKYCLLK